MHQQITEFQIGNKIPESDHIPITFSINLASPIVKETKAIRPWTPVYKYVWNPDELHQLYEVLNDDLSKNFMERFHTSLAQYENVQNVATAFTDYFSQACYRAYGVKKVNPKHRSAPHWFDSECREKRIESIKAGARIESDRDRETLVAKCKNYRSLKQRKKRAYNKKALLK